ncbi:MAG: hypothetical protein ABR522_10065 [Marinobacter sp.]
MLILHLPLCLALIPVLGLALILTLGLALRLTLSLGLRLRLPLSLGLPLGLRLVLGLPLHLPRLWRSLLGRYQAWQCHQEAHIHKQDCCTFHYWTPRG